MGLLRRGHRPPAPAGTAAPAAQAAAQAEFGECWWDGHPAVAPDAFCGPGCEASYYAYLAGLARHPATRSHLLTLADRAAAAARTR